MSLCSVEHGEPGLGCGSLQPSTAHGQGGQGEAVLVWDDLTDCLEVLYVVCQDCGSSSYFSDLASLGFHRFW